MPTREESYGSGNRAISSQDLRHSSYQFKTFCLLAEAGCVCVNVYIIRLYFIYWYDVLGFLYVQSHHEMCAPSFCYALHAADVGASCRLWNHATANAFSPRSFRSLGSIVLDKASGKGRVSFGARLLHKVVSGSESHFQMFLVFSSREPAFNLQH